jgi:hypothetical protein
MEEAGIRGLDSFSIFNLEKPLKEVCLINELKHIDE